MTTVYAVSSGSYSDYSIDAMYDNEAAAEEHVRLHNLNHSTMDSAQVEEWELNTHPPRSKTTYYADGWILPDGSLENERVWNHTGLKWLGEDSELLDLDYAGDLPVVKKIERPKVFFQDVPENSKSRNAGSCHVMVEGTDERAVMQSYQDNIARIRADRLGLT